MNPNQLPRVPGRYRKTVLANLARTCVVCGGAFQVKYQSFKVKTCSSPACKKECQRARSAKANAAQKRQAPMVVLQCAGCGGDVQKPAAYVRRQQQAKGQRFFYHDACKGQGKDRVNTPRPPKNIRRLRADGYIDLYLPPEKRPRAAQGKRRVRFPEHRVVMADVLGRELDPNETVHHIDGDRANNAPENLQVRKGKHGRGAAFRCRECGSHDIEAVRLADTTQES